MHDQVEEEHINPQTGALPYYGSTATSNRQDTEELTLTPVGDGNNAPSAQVTSDDTHENESANNTVDPQLRNDTVPSTCKELACYYFKIVIYVTFSHDSKQWIFETLKPFLETLNVKMTTIFDAIPGKPRLKARYDLINEANKTISVISRESTKDKYFSSDLSRALHKDPYPTKITVIPILYGDVTHSDIPELIKDLTEIRNDDPEFIAKMTKSIYS